jgi:hypothetical protein
VKHVPSRHRPPRFIAIVVAACLPTGAAIAADLDPDAAAIEALVADLGAADYAVRELASQRLAALGRQAADALLTAAETSPDLEVSLRARWLAESLPLVVEGDAAEAAALLDRFAGRSYGERVRVMHRLLRLDDDTGFEPLARIVQLERTSAGSRIAAALLVREWQPDDPFWPELAPRILSGLGKSRRPAARFVRALVAYSTASSPAAAAAAVDDAVTAAASLAAGQGPADEPVGLSESESLGIARTGRIFRRQLAWMLAREGRRAEALAEAERILVSAREEADPDDQLASELEWFASHDLPEAIDLVADAVAAADASPLVTYAAAVAWGRRPDAAAADRSAALAAAASRRLAEAGGLSERIQAAMLLARWGSAEWAEREYRNVLDDPEAIVGQRALAAIYFSEFLHEQGREAEAAEALAAILEPEQEMMERILAQLERDPRAVRSRMLYFRACAAADAASRRRLLEDSLRAYSKDVDTLIALYHMPDNTPAQRAEAAARVARAADGIESEIAALPDDTSGKNEYAWLVANTEGDVAQATRYSRQSLETAFDNASYLDTLAHCHAAAGDLEQAIRTQWLAVKQEPHSPLIRRNYERFRGRAAGPAAVRP